MKVIVENNHPTVVLSRRNLRVLLAKLDGHPPDSVCTIEGGTEAPGVRVRAEEDEVHYAHRDAGRMHPATEDALPAYVCECLDGGHDDLGHGTCMCGGEIRR